MVKVSNLQPGRLLQGQRSGVTPCWDDGEGEQPPQVGAASTWAPRPSTCPADASPTALGHLVQKPEMHSGRCRVGQGETSGRKDEV